MKNQLTKQQSQHLLELGVPREKMTQLVEHKGLIPIVERTFRLTDLLEILPKEIKPNKGWQKADYYELVITHTKEDEWDVNYYSWNCEEFLSNIPETHELIDALYELTVWCLENGHLKFD